MHMNRYIDAKYLTPTSRRWGVFRMFRRGVEPETGGFLAENEGMPAVSQNFVIPRTEVNFYSCAMKKPSSSGRRYRGKSLRMEGWDYRFPAFYFVTLCTLGRVPWFGEIRHKTMELSSIGRIAHQCWHDIPLHFPHVTLDAYVIMPDHVHGIIHISAAAFDNMILGAQNFAPPAEREWMPNRSGTQSQNFASLQIGEWIPNRFGPQSRNLGSIIRGFKIGVTKWAHANGHPDFAWQSRFHDRIVRDAAQLNHIRRYIVANPSAWK
jgi:putative transposase